MPLVELNGIHINYEEHGSHYGTPILLTHAFAATLQMWKPQFEAWREYRVIAWDMRGHGGTDSPPTQDDYIGEADRRGHGGAAAAPRHQGGRRSADSRSAATSRWSSSSRTRR